MTDPFMNRLREAVQTLPSPEPSAGLLPRILSDREKGIRMALPTAPPRPRFPVLLGGGAIAAAAALLIWGGSDHRESNAAAWLWPDQLYAQGAPTAGLPPIAPLDGTRLTAGVWAWRIRSRDEDGRVRAERIDSVTIDNGSYQNLPAWIVIDARPNRAADTSWFTRDSLHPLATFSPLLYGASLRETIAGDSIVRVWVRWDGEVERVALELPTPRLWDRSVVLMANERWLLFMVTPLSSSWQGSYAGIGVANTRELVTFWWDLKVTGEERITVPAGTFDCWTVAHMYGNDPQITYWVDKHSGWIVQEGLANGRYERVLLSHAAR